jgi:NAD(P)-dependent dehydrogenase (short-subunit alcohol dehydrogenase family)
VTLLVNNAGIFANAQLISDTMADARKLMETNYFGTLEPCAKRLRPKPVLGATERSAVET